MEPAKMEIQVAHDSDVASARQAGGKIAELAGLDVNQKHCVMTAISELASNILGHAVRGHIALRIVTRADGNKGIEVVARDQGPGIADTYRAMQDGYSTTGSLGGGLPGVHRLMSEMEILSRLNVGTVVRAVKWKDEPGTAERRMPLFGPEGLELDPVELRRPPSAPSTGRVRERRRFKRFAVEWHGRCESGNTRVTGLIKNVSEKGAFFEPDVSAEGRETIRPGEASSVFAKGSSWTLRLGTGLGIKPLLVKARVRWIGYQFERACEGIGLEFDVRSMEVSRLVPEQLYGVAHGAER